MHRNIVLATLVATSLLMAWSSVAVACPLCKESIRNDTAPEPLSPATETNLGQAYNTSIYLMAGMPFLLLGFFGFFVYRSVKKHTDLVQAQLSQQDNGLDDVSSTE